MQLLAILSTLLASSAAMAIDQSANPNTSDTTIEHGLALNQSSNWNIYDTIIEHDLALKQASKSASSEEKPSWQCAVGCDLPCVNSSDPWYSCPAFGQVKPGDYSFKMKYVGNKPLTIPEKDFKHGIDKCLNTHHERYKFGEDAPEGHVWQVKLKVDGKRNLDCVQDFVAQSMGEEVIPSWFKPKIVAEPPYTGGPKDCDRFKGWFNLECWTCNKHGHCGGSDPGGEEV